MWAAVMVFRYTTESAEGLSGTISLKSAQGGTTTVDATNRRITFRGTMANALKHSCTVQIAHTDGTFSADGSVLRFSKCRLASASVACGQLREREQDEPALTGMRREELAALFRKITTELGFA
ncbi:hypothetical protein [Streptomyces sp. NPDC013187]|uniref:hypothetical protein n=1 Tax=Streptomyces sp. NPDC013187 TaxID=3364865 RepID=UPI00369DF7C0